MINSPKGGEKSVDGAEEIRPSIPTPSSDPSPKPVDGGTKKYV